MSTRAGIPQASHAPHRRRPREAELKWTEQALCQQVDPEIFHPQKGQIREAREAKQICGSPQDPNCPVRAQCLAYALLHDEWDGIWGGLTSKERRELLREMKAAS